MKVNILEAEHELDLRDDINDFLKKGYKIKEMQYQVAIVQPTGDDIIYSFSCMILYEE